MSIRNLVRISLLALLAISTTAMSQISGPKSIPGDYATIAEAITALNAQGVGAGGVTFNINGGYTETFASPTAGLITATGTAENPIVFRKANEPSKTTVNPLITAGTGVSYSTDGIIVISGGDYITFDGIDLQENAVNTETKT